jgi:hypothetical protein
MNDKLQHFFENIIPFALIGISIAVGISLLFLFFHLAIWGLIIGAILWFFTLAKQYLFPDQSLKKEKGRIIEHDENKK